MTMTVADLIQAFRTNLVDGGKSPKTIESYTGDVTGFFDFLEEMGDSSPGELRRFHITSYRNHLLENGYDPSTINKKVNSLQAFNRFLIDSGVMKDNIVDLHRDRVKVASGSEKQVEVLPEKLLERLLFYIQGEKVCSRDKAMVIILLYTGVRVNELCGIKV